VAAAVLAAALVTGLVASGGLVWRHTEAAFTATAVNPGNNWTAGQVNLSDDDTGAAVFTATGVSAGIADSRCIVVTYTGDVPIAEVRVYATAYSNTGGLADDVTLTVAEDSGGTYAGCAAPVGNQIYTGTLEAFGASTYASDLGSWAPASNGLTKVYRIRYAVGAGAPVTGSTTVTFTWEART
jgi:hypothetical protein